MTSQQHKAKRILCDLCGTPSRNYDRAVKFDYIRGELKKDGWRIGVTDLCPTCGTPKEKRGSQKTPGEEPSSGQVRG